LAPWTPPRPHCSTKPRPPPCSGWPPTRWRCCMPTLTAPATTTTAGLRVIWITMFRRICRVS